MAKKQSKFLSGKRIDPTPISKKTNLADLIDESFMAYNGARLREACQLFDKKMLEDDVTIGVTLTGALTPAGLGISALHPAPFHPTTTRGRSPRPLRILQSPPRNPNAS